jgi:putative heme-binding domain-containing protein
MPEAWPAIHQRLRSSSNRSARELSLHLSIVFGDAQALAEQRQLAVDSSAQAEGRCRALESLLWKHVPDLSLLLLQLVQDPAVQSLAVRGLGAYDHPDTPRAIVSNYSMLSPTARLDAVQTLASRSKWASALLEAVADSKIPRGDLTAYTARQIDGLGDPALRERLVHVWGELRPTPQEKEEQITKLKSRLTPESLARADRSAGRLLFQKTCSSCHRLFGAGGSIGPDITGSQRTNLDYVLQTLIDPSAAVAKDFQLETVVTTGGRALTGIIVEESDKSITVQSVNERVVVPLAEVAARSTSEVSMMPEGLLQSLSTDQVRQLIAYIMSPEQAPLPNADEGKSPVK